MYKFEFDEFFWIATVTLPVWSGFRPKTEHFGEIESKDLERGTVQVLFAPEERGEEPLVESELGLVRVFDAYHVQQAGAVMRGLFEGYPKILKDYNEASYGDDLGEFPNPPDISSSDDLRSSIQLHTINIHPVERDGAPYVGYEFQCDWEEEHGLGVLMHKSRVVEIGHEDSAHTLWVVEKDANER
ncbi:MAG: hypothetical protein ABJ370_06955 [Paracoccaceae bacterium]